MRKIRIIFCAVMLIALSIALCACGDSSVKISDSDTLEDILGMAYYYADPDDGSEPDYDVALQYFEAAAERGSGEAANFIGDLYYNGEVREQNLELALQWYEKGAELGDMYAMCNLANMLENGEGCEADPERASRFYIESAELGNIWAFGGAGRMYADGIGVEQNGAKAAEWFERAIAENPEDPWAMESYAWLLLNGNGVEQDFDRAAELAGKSMAGGNPWAAYVISELSSNGYSASNELIKDAAEHFAEFGDIDCIDWMGNMYYFGEGPELDEEKALIAYEIILLNKELRDNCEYIDDIYYNCRRVYANSGSEEDIKMAALCECGLLDMDIDQVEIPGSDYAFALENIGVDLIMGYEDITPDPIRGQAVIESAGAMGNAHAYLNLGDMYFFDYNIVPKNHQTALSYYKTGAALGEENCAAMAAAMYINGDGCKSDPDEALKMLSMDGKRSEAEALSVLGVMYYYGDGIPSDMKKSFELFERSAEGGCADGTLNLIRLYLAGEGTAKDEAKAFELALQAEADGIDDSFIFTTLGNSYYHGSGTDADASKAVEYYEKGAKDDPAYSYFMLGDIYTFGPENMRDDEKALGYYKKALQNVEYPPDINDDGELFSNIGGQYNSTDTIIYDKDKSLEFLNRAVNFYVPKAEAGDGNAVYKLACAMYVVNKEYTKEQIEWLEKGVELQNTDCMTYLAGIIADSNPSKAAELYQKAYDLGCRDESFMISMAYTYAYRLHDVEKGLSIYEEARDYSELGFIYEEGLIVERDYDKALEYYLKESDNIFTVKSIAELYEKMGDYEKAAEYWEIFDNLNAA